MSGHFGVAVRAERKRLGLHQQAAGDLAGTGLNFVLQVERGKETVRIDKLVALLEELGLELHIKRGKGGVTVAPTLVEEPADEGART